jgi:hypothetical protein
MIRRVTGQPKTVNLNVRCYSAAVSLVQFLTFNRFSDFPEDGQGIGGILNGLFFWNCGFTLEYRLIPLVARGGWAPGDPG